MFAGNEVPSNAPGFTHPRRSSRFLPPDLAAVALGWLASPAYAEPVLQRVYTSAPGQNSGWFSALTQTPDGYFYGTAPSGGVGGYGSVFRMTRTGALTTRVLFNGANGSDPEGGLLLAS